MIQLRQNRTTNIPIHYCSLYPAASPPEIKGKCLIEIHKTIGGISRTFEVQEIFYDECKRLFTVPFLVNTKLKAGEWTINVYIKEDDIVFKYTNLANIL